MNDEKPTNETGVRDTIRNPRYLEANHLYGDISASHPRTDGVQHLGIYL